MRSVHERLQIVLYRLALVIGCHQRSDRSYFIRGRQIPVCARCLGLLIGFILAPLLWISGLGAAALLVPMLVDGVTQAGGLRESRNWLRLTTGVGFAIGLGALLISAFKFLWNT